ncbi:MAG: hypothetical protein ABMA15_12805 [Vicinamibacterales bacterium]
MLRLTRFIAIVVSVALGTSLFAQTQVATAVSSSRFEIRGARVNPSLAVPTWPVMPGDTIKAGDTPVTLTFADGSTIVLAPHANARLNLSDGIPSFQLESDSAHYTLKELNGVRLLARADTVVPKELVGDITLGESRLPAGWWTTKKTVLLIAAAAGLAGVTVGLVTQNGAPVSPIQ